MHERTKRDQRILETAGSSIDHHHCMSESVPFHVMLDRLNSSLKGGQLGKKCGESTKAVQLQEECRWSLGGKGFVELEGNPLRGKMIEFTCRMDLSAESDSFRSNRKAEFGRQSGGSQNTDRIITKGLGCMAQTFGCDVIQAAKWIKNAAI